MTEKKQRVKCPWCGEVIDTTTVKVRHFKNDYGTIVERRCSRCDKVVAAYLEEEGNFLPRMRTF